jgi:predicted ATPase
VPGRGYRLTAQTRDITLPDADAASAAAPETAPVSLRHPATEPRPSFAPSASGIAAKPSTNATSGPEAWVRSQGLGVSPFIGRHAELSELLALVLTHRVTTLTGAPGIGKTRLAIETAQRLAPHFPDGTVCAPLGALTQPSRVVDAIAIVLGIEPNAQLAEPGALAARIGNRRVLLLVDHCDHLIDAASRAIQTLIASAPELRVIVTCEMPLSFSDERVIAIGPLRTPPAPLVSFQSAMFGSPPRAKGTPDSMAADAPADLLSYDATQLLLSGVAQKLDDQGFIASALPPAAIAAAAHICWRLEGLPFALELAAAAIAERSRAALPAGQGVSGVSDVAVIAAMCAFADSLDAAMTRRTGAQRIVLPRAAMVPAMIDLSANALDAQAQATLRRLGVFAGAAPQESVIRLLAAFDPAPDHIHEARVHALVAHGLLKWVDCDGELRLRLPMPVRHYALAGLDREQESAAAVAHHASEIARAMAERFGTGLASANAHSRHDIDDLRAALEWGISTGKFEMCADLLDQTAPVWIALSLVDEYAAWVRWALARVESGSRRPVRDEMRLLAALARALSMTPGASALTEALASWQRTYELANACADTPYRLRALYTLAIYALEAGEVERCRELQQAFSEVAMAAGSAPAALNALRFDGVLRVYAGDNEAGIAVLAPIVEGSWASGGKSPANNVLHEANQMATGFGLSMHLVARAVLAAARWITGEPYTAESLREACRDPSDGSEPIAVCIALSFACALAAFDGDIALTEYFAAALVDRSRAAGLRRFLRAGLDFQLWIEAQHGARGDRAIARRLVMSASQRIGRERVYLIDIALISTLFPLADITDEADAAPLLRSLRAAISRGERSGERWHMPELMRIEAMLRLGQGESRPAVRRHLLDARQMARAHDAHRLTELIDTTLAALATSADGLLSES